MSALNLGPVQLGDRPSSVQSAVPNIYMNSGSQLEHFLKWPCLEACLVDLVESGDDDHSI